MTVRPPLSRGDDGSGNRYTPRRWYGYRNGEAVRGPMSEADANRALAAREVQSIAPEPDEGNATDDAYDVRIWCDGDELVLPFRMHAGKDYTLGESLFAIAGRYAYDVLRQLRLGDSMRVALFAVPTEELPCERDTDPVELAWGEAFRD